ncbi:unnamed protein product [Rhizophagus irregularis]|nr:unnamed protein product [Rhizophagus irregularis]
MDNIKKWTILNSLMMNVERKSAKIDSYTDSRNNDKKAGYMKQRWHKLGFTSHQLLMKLSLNGRRIARRRTRRGTKTEQVLHEQSDEANKENIAENPYGGGNSNNTSK